MPMLSEINIQEMLIHKIAHLTGRASQDISLTAPLAEYGLDSVHAVGLSGDLEELLGIDIEPTLAWDFPTIREISHYLSQQMGAV
jgi:8-amino-7-oxononanoate synthase